MSIKSQWVLAGLMLASSSLSFAESIITTVFNVIESHKSESLLVLSGIDGHVYKTQSKSDDMKKYMATFKGKVVDLTFTKSGTESIITGIRPVAAGEVDLQTMDLNHFQYNQLRQFAPTELKGLDEATEIFHDMLNDGDKRRSQCFKRAHMWAFDMWSHLGINSEKVFIFYTQRYIQLEEFEWWFHVAPVVSAKTEKYVVDGTFMKKPVTINEWQHFFIKSDKVNCPIVKDYSEYTNGQFKKLCYLMLVPMYYLSPLDIERRDSTEHVTKDHWVLEELQDARRAFKDYGKTYEGLDTGTSTIKY
jgi:hypothetical protein